MRYLLSIWLITLVSLSHSQERWVTVVDGWMAGKVLEFPAQYLCVGKNALSPSRHTHQFNSLDLGGNLSSSWQFYIDTTYSTSFLREGSTKFHSNKSSIYIAGNIRVNGSFAFVPMLFKYKSDFTDTLTVIKFPFGDSGGLREFHEKEPNKLIVLGTYQLYSDYKVRARLFETDTLGAIAWQKEYMCGGDCWMSPYQITPLPDGGYFYTNEEIHYRTGTYDIDFVRATLIRTDATGNQVWRKYYGSTSFDNERPYIVSTDDGNYLMFWCKTKTAGWNGKQIADDATINVAKIDVDGNILWQRDYVTEVTDKSLAPIFYVSDVYKHPDGNVVLCGKAGVLGMAFIMKINQNGDVLWYREHRLFPDNDVTFHGLYNAYGLTHTSDNGYAIAAEYSSDPSTLFPSGIQTGVVIKLDEYGCLEENCHILSAPSISPEE